MSFFFNRGRSRTSAADLARQTAELVSRDPTKIDDALLKCLAQIKAILQGTPEAEASPEQVSQLVHGLVDEHVLSLLPPVLHLLPFESRKDVQVIFSFVFRYRGGASSSSSGLAREPGPGPAFGAAGTPAETPLAVDYVTRQAPSVLVALCHGYDHKESATTAGSILREVLKHEAAAAVILYDGGDEQDGGSQTAPVHPDSPQSGRGIFWRFFTWIDTSSFEVAADAFTTFRELLTRHKDLVPRYLHANFDLFFARYNSALVQSSSYVTKRQSIKLLGEILLDRANYVVMTRYVDSGEHLKICMNLLRDDRKMVQYEGFHVFKIFVANPHKSVAVQKILIMNRDKLLSFLAHFLEERTEDEQFMDERDFLLRQIRNMPAKPVPPQR